MATPRRWYTVFRNLGWMAVAVLGCEILAMLLRGGTPVLDAVSLCAAVALLLVGLPLAILLGIFRPVCSDEPTGGWRLVFAGVFGSLGLAFAVGLVFAVVCLASSLAGVRDQKSEGTFANLAELRKDRLAGEMTSVLDGMVPPEATEIRFSGWRGGFIGFGYASFSCKVSEPDFMRFAAERAYPLATNVFRNANVEIVDGDHYPAELDMDQISGWLFSDYDGKRPEHYISYWFGYRNNGGVILAFDLDTQTLYGSYSSN